MSIFKNIYFEEHLQTAAFTGVLLEIYNNINIYEQNNCIFLNVKSQ